MEASLGVLQTGAKSRKPRWISVAESSHEATIFGRAVMRTPRRPDSVNVVKEEPCLEDPNNVEEIPSDGGRFVKMENPTSGGFLQQMSLMSVRKMEKNELRAVTKFFHLKKLSAKEILTEIMAVLGNGAVTLGMVKNWIAEFQSDQDNTDTESRPELPSLSIIDNHIGQTESMVYAHR
uniref:uncharacterized protein isoform X2 n=1 Tax=Myxine glutinosa TaxID=7769 RepID=UPI00358F73BB